LKHDKRGFAVVFINRKRVYLGAWGSPQALAAYQRILDEHQAKLPPAHAADAPPPAMPTRPPASVDELCERYDAWARAYFVKRGKPTTRALNIGRALTLLYRSGEALARLDEFGPLALTRFQHWLASHARYQVDPATGQAVVNSPWARSTINEYTAIVVGMFRWAAAREWVKPDQVVGLGMVARLKRGRAPAPGIPALPEGRKVRPVERSDVRVIRRRLPLAVRAMINVQLLTGARPNEVCMMRLDAIDRAGPVWAYLVPADAYKLDHLGERPQQRVLYLGPRCQRVLRPLVEASLADGNPFLFSPRRTVKMVAARKRSARTLPAWPSHAPELRAMRRMERAGKPASRAAGQHYTPSSYRVAIARACRAAGIAAWTPYQLRHNRATDLASTEGLEVAQRMLGHTSISTTMRYVEVTDRRTMEVAARRG
jgi:integrase